MLNLIMILCCVTLLNQQKYVMLVNITAGSRTPSMLLNTLVGREITHVVCFRRCPRILIVASEVIFG